MNRFKPSTIQFHTIFGGVKDLILKKLLKIKQVKKIGSNTIDSTT